MRGRRIAFVCLGEWGSTHCLRARELGKELRSSGWNVDYCIPRHLAPQPEPGEDFSLMRLPSDTIGFVHKARRWLKTIKPDYVHFLNPEVKASLITICCPWIKTIGDWEDWHAVSRDKGLRRVLTVVSDKFMRNRVDILITASYWFQQKLKSMGRKEVTYIPYAVLPRQFPTLNNPFAEPTAVYMGNLNLQWDHDVILDAAKILQSRGISANMRIIGSGPDFHHCLSFKQRHGLKNLEFTGYLNWDEMLNSLQWAHVLLFPIRDKIANWARCPFKIFQYAQAKRPIITSKIGEVPRMLGENAIWTESTPEAFADAIAACIAKPRSPSVDYGIEAHSWEARASDFMEMINAYEQRNSVT